MSIEDSSPGYPPENRRERPWWRLPIILAMIALPAGGLWYFYRKTERGGRGQEPPASIGVFNKSDSLSSSLATSTSSHARFACRKLLVVNRSGQEELMREVGQRLYQRLGKLGYVESVDYQINQPAPGPPLAPQGGPAPDLVVTLEADDLKTTDRGSELRLEATIAVRAGNRPAASRHFSIDNATPPLIEFDWNATLKHQSTTGGIANPSGKYEAAAEDIAKQIADALSKQFAAWRNKWGELPRLPTEFYPAYREAPTLPLAEGQSLVRIASWHGLMTANDTLWGLQTPRTPAEVLAEIEKKMEGAGWKTESFLKLATGPHLRMRREAAVVEVFLDSRSTEGVPAVAAAKGQNPPGPRALYVRYTERMAAAEREAAMRALLAPSTPSDVLLLFEQQWNDTESRQALDLLKARQAKTPDACLTLARLYHRAKQDGEAGEMLLRAHVLLRTVEEEGDRSAQVENLAKELGKQDLAGQAATPELLAKMGFVELKPRDSISREIGLDEPAYFFATNGEGELKTMSIRVLKGDSAGSFQLAHVDAWGRTRSSGKGGMNYRAPIEGICDVQFRASPIGPKERFKLTANVSSKAPQAKPAKSGRSSQR